MEQLIRSGLYGKHLILVDTPDTVGRYNGCLEVLGLKHTKLKKFHIDGIGWSPEIAEEKGDSHYLSHGPANPLGIIVTVNQRDCPVYMPAHSFDRVMLKEYFEQHREAVANLTVLTGIGLYLDQRLTWYETLDDIAMIKSVSVSSVTCGISRYAEEQQRLIDRFMNPEKDEWMDDTLREAIIASVGKHGVLAGRALSIPEFEFSGFDDLYSIAFGGVYVFRHDGELALIVVEDESQKNNVSKKLKSKVATLSDKDLLKRLLKEEIAGIDLEWYRDNPWAIEDRLEVLVISKLLVASPELDPSEMTHPQLISAFRELPKEETALYREIKRVLLRLKEGEENLELSDEAKLFLLHPIRTSTRYEANLVWRLICQMQDTLIRVMRMYAVDKNLFLERFHTWSPMTRKWVIKYISGTYDSNRTYND